MKKILRKTIAFKIFLAGTIGLVLAGGAWLTLKKIGTVQGAPTASKRISIGQPMECRQQVIGENKENTRTDLFVNCGGFLE